jgi:hypothetical protein
MVPRAVKAITVVQEAPGSGMDTGSAEAGRSAGGAASGGTASGGAVPGGAVPRAGADAAGDVGEYAGPGGSGGVAARWAAVGAVAAGALADPARLVCTDAGSAAAQGTRPHSFGGPEELSCRARAKPPPATTAMVAVMPAAATQRCRTRLSASRGGPAGGWSAGGWSDPLATAAHRLIPGTHIRHRRTRDMAVSPILVRPLTNPGRRGQFSNVTGIFDDKHTSVGWRCRIAGTGCGAWCRPGLRRPCRTRRFSLSRRPQRRRRGWRRSQPRDGTPWIRATPRLR